MTDFFEDAIRWAAVSASARTATTAGVAAPGAATVGAAATVTSSVGAAAASAAGARARWLGRLNNTAIPPHHRSAVWTGSGHRNPCDE